MIDQLPLSGLLGNSLRLNGELRGRRPFGPVALALHFYPSIYPTFLGYWKVRKGDGRVRNLGVPIAVVADERCPCPASQDLVELNPHSLQLAQPLGGPRYLLEFFDFAHYY